MDKKRIDVIKDVGDRLSNYIQNNDSIKTLNNLEQASNYNNFRNILRKILKNKIKNGDNELLFTFDDYVITPEQSFYEIALIRPKSIDDVNYVVDQVIEEKNPVIVDLSFLERESHANFRLAGEKIKKMRTRYGAQALLLARSENKNLIIISPEKVKLVNKN